MLTAEKCNHMTPIKLHWLVISKAKEHQHCLLYNKQQQPQPPLISVKWKLSKILSPPLQVQESVPPVDAKEKSNGSLNNRTLANNSAQVSVISEAGT